MTTVKTLTVLFSMVFALTLTSCEKEQPLNPTQKATVNKEACSSCSSFSAEFGSKGFQATEINAFRADGMLIIKTQDEEGSKIILEFADHGIATYGEDEFFAFVTVDGVNYKATTGNIEVVDIENNTGSIYGTFSIFLHDGNGNEIEIREGNFSNVLIK